MGTKILAAVDRSKTSEAVVAAAAVVARGADASVLLVSVAPREPDAFGRQVVRKVITEPVPSSLRERHELLVRLAARLREAGIACETLMVRGDPGPTLIDEARRAKASLIVMGSHGRGALYRNLIGSVSETVLRDGRFPVLVVPARWVETRTAHSD
jgi:nucleotide-binding universal stress UspA family protein